ncbi:hypothetical protein CkaCkLH20_01040 [Colletotrichum karsti]|uniref:Uncharacterized protein n=1 Tax=Colletotrichum karsti TaxID=1095194 RepID=A0A9P6LMV5_9PEZI|nr:uncharacterized protein CkaCkLH20_01040 [Colletotrichum karsti]KAF9881894.1 hypothetical protein CkaCkLH20_01040 [Colletotrichum karsti]
MSASAPVPSKAAIHALRGLLFGTSCSLVLLAEERRQRIKIARSAVENGRKLKSLKRYSTNGRAAIQALQEEVRTDPDFVGWSSRSRSKCSLDLDNVAQDLGPDPRRPTRPAKQTKDREKPQPSTTTSSSSTEHATLPTPHRRFASDLARGLDHESSWPSFSIRRDSMRSVSGARGVAQHMSYHTDWKHKQLALVLDNFREEFPHLCSEEEMGHGFPPDSDRYTPQTAVSLVRQVYKSVASSRELPAWFIDFSSSLCVALQRISQHHAAAEILAIVVEHGPLSLRDYLLHRPLRLIAALASGKYTEQLMGKNLSARAEYTNRVKGLFLAQIVDMAQIMPDVLAPYINTGRKLIVMALSLNCGAQIMKVFGRVKYITETPTPEIIWFIERLVEYKEHALAIDTFAASYAGLNGVTDTKEMCGVIVDCIVKSKGYAALEVLNNLNQISKRDGWHVDVTWVDSILWSYWKASENYKATLKLINHVQDNGFYGIKDTYEIRRSIVRIGLEGNDGQAAQLNFENLSTEYPAARNDMELRVALARRKASSGDWAGVRAEFEAMKATTPFTQQQQKSFSNIFTDVLQIYSKTHTWGETETFLETYVQELDVALNSNLVRFIANRHGRCRDIKAMVRWLEFCRMAGFHIDLVFWRTLFQRCKRDWKYGDRDCRELYREMTKSITDPQELSVASKAFKELKVVRWDEQLALVRLKSHRHNPADKRRTLDRMCIEAQHENWAVVQSIYNRAVHNGMGYSSRCLHLVVLANVRLNGPRCEKASSLLARAQAEGHDISHAVMPVILAKFDEVKEWYSAHTDSEGRGWPFRAIKTIISEFEDKGIHIVERVYNRAAEICIALRNYREAIALCVTAAEKNGHGDLCYSLGNFRNLVYAYTVRHEYVKLRWVISQLVNHHYRFEHGCRQVLNRSIHYLKVASQIPKAEEFVRADLETLEYVRRARELIGREHHIAKADAQEEIIDAALPGRTRSESERAEAVSERAASYLKIVAENREFEAARLARLEMEEEEVERGDYDGSPTPYQEETSLHRMQSAEVASY